MHLVTHQLTRHYWLADQIGVRLYDRIGFAVLGDKEVEIEDTTDYLVGNASFAKENIHAMGIEQ